MSIANEITRLQTAKADLKTAIIAKGVEVADTDTIDTYASKVEAIESGGVEHSDYINPKWTSWVYFSHINNRNSLVSKLKYSDTSNGTNFGYMFNSCSGLTSIPMLDTSNGTNFGYMFNGCSGLTSIPMLNTSNGTNFVYMFNGCRALKNIPELDVSNGVSFTNAFSGCKTLTTIPPLDTSKGKNFTRMFDGDDTLISISELNVSNATDTASMFQTCNSLTTITFIGVIPITISFGWSPLSLESAINVITHLKNYAGTENEFVYSVTFSTTTWGYLDAEGETASPNGNSWREYINDLGWNAS